MPHLPPVIPSLQSLTFPFYFVLLSKYLYVFAEVVTSTSESKCQLVIIWFIYFWISCQDSCNRLFEILNGLAKHTFFGCTFLEKSDCVIRWCVSKLSCSGCESRDILAFLPAAVLMHRRMWPRWMETMLISAYAPWVYWMFARRKSVARQQISNVRVLKKRFGVLVKKNVDSPD